MIVNKAWEFPVPSTSMHSNYVNLLHQGYYALLYFDYFDRQRNVVLNSGICFEGVQAVRHTSEKFILAGTVDADYVSNARDRLVEYQDSEWVAYFRELDRETADFWSIRHYGICLDSVGFFEFLASGFKVLETREGSMDGFRIPQ